MDEMQAFIKIKENILLEKSLDVSQYKENYLKRRIAVRMRSLQMIKYADYLNLLLTDKNEYEKLLDKLTINVTQFFRDPEIFTELENSVLPEILEKNPSGIKIWSAGCSTGEEPYSVAISIQETAERLGIKNYNFEIHATDLDQIALARAAEGKYEGRTLDNIVSFRKSKYFTTDGKFFYIKDVIKQKVKIIRLNLMEPYKKDLFNIVFCRNVIIYFTRELQKTVLQHYYDSLKEGGILFLGKTETMLTEYRDRFSCINIKERIFKKI
jgi:chemotaxis protein methyltransferase CheR